MHEKATTPIHPIPTGLCQCACGNKTNIIKKTSLARGRIKGEPSRFLPGHNTRKPVRYKEADTGWESPCWIWTLAKTQKGYGIDWDSTGKKVRAHRRYYEAKFGPIPADRQLDHLCRVRACVNPVHLEPVTCAENVRRGSNTKLNAEIVIQIRSSTDKQHVLARRYGITQSQVSRIKCGRCWRDVPG